MRYRELSYFLTLILCLETSGLHPIILVPGDGGSQMDAKLNKSAVVHYLCNKKTDDYFNIWLNLELLVPVIIDCWIDNVRLVYNATTRTTQNSPGVEIRVPGFGNTTTVEYLDPSRASPGLYFKSIVEQSLIPLGYNRNHDIRGAPYDFRKAPNEMGDWFKDFKDLVERAYAANENQSVILLAHSMGSPLSLYFLNLMSKSWKAKHIRALMTLGGVWGGSVKALKVFAAGDDLGSYVLPSHTLRGQQMTNPSTAWLLPSPHFWKNDEVLVELEGVGNLTVQDYQKFFKEMDYGVGYEMWKDTRNLLKGVEHPGTEVHCLYGSGISTVESLYYKDEASFPGKPKLVNGNGDGTVNIRSLRGCLRWTDSSNSQDPKKRNVYRRKDQRIPNYKPATYRLPSKRGSPKVFYEEYPGVDHMMILRDSNVIKYIKDTVGQMNLELLSSRRRS